MQKKLFTFFINAATFVVLISSYYYFVFIPTQLTFKHRIEHDYLNGITINKLLLDNTLTKYVEGARSISSRSAMRDRIVDFKKGKTNLFALKTFTNPKLADGIKALDDCVYSVRYVNNFPIAEYAPSKTVYSILPDSLGLFSSPNITIKNSTIYTTVVSPIKLDSSILGYDILYFENKKIFKDILDQNFEFQIISKNSDLNELVSDSLFYDSSNITALKHSAFSSIFYNFSKKQSIVFSELADYQNGQILVLGLLALTLLLILIFIQRRAKFVFSTKNKYLTDQVSQKTSELKNMLLELNVAKVEIEIQKDKYQTIIDNTFDWEYWIDENDSLSYVSPSCKRITGYEPIDFYNNPNLLNEIIYHEDREVFTNHFNNIGDIEHLEFRIVTKDMQEKWISHVCKNVYDKKGNYIGIRGSNTDITTKHLIELELIKSEDKFKKAFYISPDSIAINRLSDGVYVSINKGFSEILGYSEADIIGQSSIDFNIWHNLDDRKYLTKKLLSNGIINNLECKFIAKDGSVLDGLMSATIIELNHVQHILSITREITSRKNAEETLRESEKLMRKIAENFPNSYLSIIEKDFTVSFTSGQELKKQNLDPSSFNGLSVEQIFGDNSPLVLEEYGRTFDGEERSFELFINNQHQEFRTVPLVSEDGSINRILAVVENITEWKLAENALRESEERFSLFMDYLPAIVFIKDSEGKTLFVNKYMDDALGASKWMGKTMFEVFPNEFGEKLIADDKRVMELGYQKIEESIPHQDGKLHNYETQKFVLHRAGLEPMLGGVSLDITERKLAEKELLAREVDLKESQRIAQLGSWRLDISTNKVTWSEELYKMYGFDPSLPPPILNESNVLFTPESWELLSKSIAKTAETGIPYEIELKLTRRDGSNGWMLAHGEVVIDEKGITVGLRGVAQDITERKQKQEELNESNLLLSRAEKTAKIGNWKLNFNIKEFTGSPGAKIVYGIEDNNLAIQRVQKIPLPAYREMIDKALSNLIAKNIPYNIEYKIFRPSDNKILDIHSVAEFDKENNIVYGVIQDITEQKQIEEALRNSEEKLSTLFGSMTEMVVLHELVFNEAGEAINYRLTDCNNAFTEITGIKKENVIGKLATEVYKTEIAPYLDIYSNVAITRKPYEYVSYFAPMDKHFSISVVSPQQNQFATITTDITTMQQIQKVISDKNKELENFLYVSSHDLRTPLVNVQGFSNRLQKQIDSIKTLIDVCSIEPEAEAKINSIIEEGIPKTLGFILTNVSKMDILINSLLEISRTGRVKMTIKKIEINKLIENIISSLNYQITELSAKVITQQLSDCYGDENLLNQLFTNIIVNAIKYRNKEIQLVLEISSKIKYNKVIYSLKDNGIGIAPNHLEKIWDVFYRVDSASPEAGDGIGLSLSKKIVDKHKGKIWAESEERKGSVFSIELLTNEFIE